MDDTRIVMTKKVKLKNPILVVGLPGIGSVGKLIAEHMRKEFKFEKIAIMYSPHFPHQVVMLKGGSIRLVGNRLYLLKNKKVKNDIVLLTGETQAVDTVGQYNVNHKIVQFFKKELGGKFIYTLGGYNTAREMSREPKVFGNVTKKEVIKQFANSGVIFGKSRGVILGSAGMILAFAKMARIDGICLMGETSMLDIDATAAKAVLKILVKQLGLQINYETLDKIIEQTATALKELEKHQAGGAFPTDIQQKPSYIR